jgi:HD superfamily phosphohydrolase
MTDSPQYSKLIMCNIHGPVRIDPLSLRIINTPEFQRMREIKQLGLCYLVYPTATHTRFEHSIGVYHLAGKVLEKIKQLYPNRIFFVPELGPTVLTDKVIFCIKIAALCHDLGHGPFSHVFDNILLKNISHPNKHHEVRSCLITEMLCKRELSDELSIQEIEFIKSIIHPSDHHVGALYQIVANHRNGIDIDKFDYLLRDTKNLNTYSNFNFDRLMDEFIIDHNDNIVYPKHCSIDVYELFHTRYIMHKKIYTHKTVILVESMINDMFIKIDPVFRFSKFIDDMSLFCQLTDSSFISYIKNTISPYPFFSINLSDNEMLAISDAYHIYLNILHRKLYKQIIEIHDENNNIKNELEMFVDYLIRKHPNLNRNKFQIIKTKVGFIDNKKVNPFDHIFFYDKKENGHIFKANETHIANLINNKHNEIVWRLVYKDSNLSHQILEDIETYKFIRILGK